MIMEYEPMDDILTEEVQELFSESSDTDEDIDEGEEILRRFQSIDWGQIRPRIYMEDSDWDTNIFYLAPRQVLPQMYWNDADKQLQVTLHIFTGTGVDAEELHVLQKTEGNELEDYWLTPGEWAPLLSERIGFSYEKDTHIITFYDNQDGRELVQADLSWLEEKEVERIEFGDIAHFQLGNEIHLGFTPGYLVKEWATPQYDEIPEMKVQVHIQISNHQMNFKLGEIEIN